MLRCPECRQTFESTCPCGFKPRIADGVVDMTTAEQRAFYDPVVADYEARRAEQNWGGEDLDLPEAPIRHRDYWAFRSRSFRALEGFVRSRMSGGTALDVGAGNCWLTRHIDRWGFDATALDIDAGRQDGVGAGAAYLTQGDHFERVRGVMTDLPFGNRTFDLVVASNALHWSPDIDRTLAEFRRVLTPGGWAVVNDSPWFEKQSAGERRVSDRVEDLTDEPGLIPVDSMPFLYRARFDAAARNNGFRWELRPVYFGIPRLVESLTARFYQRGLARFPLVALEKRPRPPETGPVPEDGSLTGGRFTEDARD